MNYLEERRNQKLYGKPAKEKKSYRIPAKSQKKIATEAAEKAAGILQKKKQKAIPKFSKKREEENETYFGQREKFLETKKNCEARLPGCTKKATEVHHGAGRVGENFLDETTWLAVCRMCHRYLELNPIFAKENGLSVSRLSKT